MVFRGYWWKLLSNILIIVEGLTDRSFIEGISEKMGIKCKVLVMRGNKPDKAKRLIKSFIGWLDKALIIKDIHMGEQSTLHLISRLESKLKDLERNGLSTHLICIRSIESWILAGLCVNGAEDLLNSEEKLREILWERGKHYIKSAKFYRQLAKEINLEKAITKSKSFRNFINLLKGKCNNQPMVT